MDKKLAAEKVRARLEKRIAAFLGCDVIEVPRMKLGTLIHVAFLFWGDEETVGGFRSTMIGMLDLVGHDLMWDLEEPKVEEPPKTVIN